MIRITFFDNRIDIESPGFLLPGMTVQDIRSGVSRIRNPVIAQIFRELHLTEQWGSGVKRIFAEATAQRLPEPRVVETVTGVRLSVFWPPCKMRTRLLQRTFHLRTAVSKSVHKSLSKWPSCCGARHSR